MSPTTTTVITLRRRRGLTEEIDKEVGYRWLRHEYLVRRRQGKSVDEVVEVNRPGIHAVENGNWLHEGKMMSALRRASERDDAASYHGRPFVERYVHTRGVAEWFVSENNREGTTRQLGYPPFGHGYSRDRVRSD